MIQCLQRPADAPVCDVFHTEGAADTLVGKDGIVLTRVEDKIIDKLAMIPRKRSNAITTPSTRP